MSETLTSHSARAATLIIATVMVGAVVWWLLAILAPLALFLMLIIDTYADAQQSMREANKQYPYAGL